MEFKPNLIPNHPKGSNSLETVLSKVEKNGGIQNYFITVKKDGCRMELLDGRVLTRELKEPQSVLVKKRFQPLATLANELGLVLEGEFYSHGMKFNEIFRFFSNTSVVREEEFSKLTKLKEKNPKKFKKEYGERSIDWLTTFHPSLQFWLFDAVVLDDPDLGYLDRLSTALGRLKPHLPEIQHLMKSNAPIPLESSDQLERVFNLALEQGWEGLVLTHIEHKYKMGRSTLNQGTLLKLKDDANEYDGVILDVLEGTNVKEGVETTKDNFGHSVTSKKRVTENLLGWRKAS